MNVPDEQLAELIKLANEIENGAVAAEAITFEEAIEGILPVVLDRHTYTAYPGRRRPDRARCAA